MTTSGDYLYCKPFMQIFLQLTKETAEDAHQQKDQRIQADIETTRGRDRTHPGDANVPIEPGEVAKCTATPNLHIEAGKLRYI
jgi:hypothetical protein